LGCLGQDMAASGGHRNCARGRKSRLKALRICFWRGGATAGGHRPRRRAVGHALRRNPRKARFSAQPKMRPNEVLPESHIFVNLLQGEAL
jgi:hypothetical protein